MHGTFPLISFFLLSALLTCSDLASASEHRCLPQFLKTLMNSFHRSPERRILPKDQRFVLDGSIYIPLIGDVHGELDRFLSLISQLQIEYKVKFPIIFQLGDLGINQDPVRYPRWHQKNGTEINEFFLGDNRIFNKYFGTSYDLNRIEGNIFVVRGNHDFYLDEFLYTSKVSSFADHFFILPDGVMQELELISGERIYVGAAGGINETDSFGQTTGSRMAQTESELRAKNREPGARLRHDRDNLPLEQPQSTILLTHQGPTFEVKGHTWIENLILTLKPRFHFHGHSHYALNLTTRLGDTETIAVGNLPPKGEVCTTLKCIAMLRYDLKTRKIHLVSPQLESH